MPVNRSRDKKPDSAKDDNKDGADGTPKRINIVSAENGGATQVIQNTKVRANGS